MIGEQHDLPLVLRVPHDDAPKQMRTLALRLGAGQENDGVGVDVAVDRHVALVDDGTLR